MQQALSLASLGAKSEFLSEESVRELVLEQYDREHVPLWRYVVFLGLDADMSRDVVQDCFLKLQQHLAGNGDRENLRAWLYRVAHNLARNRQTKADANHGTVDDLTGFAEPAAPGGTPEQVVLADERERVLRRAIGQLSAAQRECLVLRAQGLKYREIAEVIGISVSTVGENIQRGLEKLKESV